MLFDMLRKEIYTLNQSILKQLPGRTTGYPISIDGIRFNRLWVHFGLNGSDHDTAKGKDIEDCFIKSITHLAEQSYEFNNVKLQLKDKGYIYDRYFSKPVEFYSSLNWYQTWQHPDYFDVFSEHLKMSECLPGVSDFFKKHQKTRKDDYVIFSDLLFVRERNSKNISKNLILDTHGDLIWDSLQYQIKYYKPCGITIANAQAQDFVRKRLNGEKYSYLLYLNDIPVILSSQFSGGALSDPLFGLLRNLFTKVVNR
ncbi:hypothetical protein [Paenibacillus sp. FSL R7-0026]|uniref:hypothetical protein n=1 Tax=Paenibacillus sp. FSL R7-0026 TaxID=2921668 RepID=UPI0030F7D5AE